MHARRILITAFALLFVLGGCASFRQDYVGRYAGALASTAPQPGYSTLFVIRHTKFLDGKDSVPKIIPPSEAVRDFNDVFKDALKELPAVGSYNTFVESAADVENPFRRKEKSELVAASDVTVEIEVRRTESFRRNFLGMIASLATIAIVPVPYPSRYDISVTVTPRGGTARTFTRTATVTTWVHLFTIVYYPVYVPEKVTEEIYLDALRDVFRQISAEQAFVKR